MAVTFARYGITAASAIAAVLALALVGLAERERRAPSFCGPGLVILGAHCCGQGQTLKDGRCAGMPFACPPEMRLVTGSNPGCVSVNPLASFGGGTPGESPPSWSPSRLAPPAPAPAPAGPFVIDGTEVTWARYDECVEKRRCVPQGNRHDPGLPAADVTPEQAEAYCRFAQGRLPTGTEWLLAAAGREGRRFPWGNTGLACRRSAFGMLNGPCAEHGGPTLAGARPDGGTPDGVLDLSGNVAEWTREPDGGVVARGGSFRSKLAAELDTSAVEHRGAAPSARWSSWSAPHIGFRCAYDRVQ